MISVILDFLRLLFSPDTRETLGHISSFVAKSQKNWKADIKTSKAKFSGDESYKVSVFANSLFDELKKSGISNEKADKFRIVFTELITNAFEHGCKHRPRCRVKVHCTYSPWFIRLRVTDSGNGFDLLRHLSSGSQVDEKNNDEYPHGLQVVNKLTYRLYTNKKGNSVTAFLASQDSLEILPAVETYKGKEIFVIYLVTEEAWYYMSTTWEPLKRAVENVSHQLILIDCTDNAFSTKDAEEARRVIAEFKDRREKFYAFVLHDKNDYFELKRLDSYNFQVFYGGELEQAKDWLVERPLAQNN